MDLTKLVSDEFGPVASADDLVDPFLKRAYAYWLARRNEQGGVPWSSIDIADFKGHLDKVCLVDIRDGEKRYLMRVVGDYWRELTDVEGTNTYLEDWPNENQRRRLMRSYTETERTGVPHRGRRIGLMDGRYLQYEALNMPIGPARDTVRRLLIVLAPAVEVSHSGSAI